MRSLSPSLYVKRSGGTPSGVGTVQRQVQREQLVKPWPVGAQAYYAALDNSRQPRRKRLLKLLHSSLTSGGTLVQGW